MYTLYESSFPICFNMETFIIFKVILDIMKHKPGVVNEVCDKTSSI